MQAKSASESDLADDSLQQQQDVQKGLVIITGHGKGRALKQSSIVQETLMASWLNEQGIQCSIDPRNEGRVIVSKGELQAYVARQRSIASQVNA